MRFGYLIRSLVLCLALFGVFTNAQTVATAHVVYNGSGLFYADNEENFKFQPAKQERNGTYTITFNEERLKPSAIEDRRLRFGLQCTEGTKNCESYLYQDETTLPTLKELFPDYVYQEKDQPIYEVWLSVDASGVTILPGIPEEYVVPDPVEKVFRLLPSWSNTSAIMIVDGDSTKMVPAQSPYCGWFETTVKIVPKNAYASFKQTIGDTYIGSDGISHKPIAIEDEISLDSILNVDPSSDTVWIMAKYGFPEIYSTYPDELGDCPVKKLPVMMFDWLHGTEGDGVEGNGNPKYGVSADFGSGGCKNDSSSYKAVKGMVENELGPNGVPVRAQDFPSNCKITEHLDYWFTPEVVAKDAAGKQYTNVTCRDLTLELDNDGFWLGQRDKDSPERGLFLLDDFIWLDSAHTIKNPYHDEVLGVINTDDTIGVHNYGYTMKIQAQFEYVPGQYFEFFGDDDVWVFIDNKLVVDIGGQHHQVSGKVKLDTIGKGGGKALVPGQTYPFHIFYAERHSSESNFKMRTSIDLRSDASMFLKDLSSVETLIQKEVWQKVNERELACDFSSSPENQKVERGPSNFILYGKSLPKGGVQLKTLDSLYYKGIKVQNGFTLLEIDLEAINKARALQPGTYYVRISLKENPDEYKDVYFTIDPYEMPNIAFAFVKDSSYKVIDFDTQDTLYFTEFWSPWGDEAARIFDVSSDTLPLNAISSKRPINLDTLDKLWAGRSYPVNIMYAEEWATIYSDIAVKITTSTPALVPCDSMGNPIDEVVLVEGHAKFYVKAVDAVVNGTLTLNCAGSTNKTASWTKINFAVPPVPQIELANIYDRDGDGRADSIWILLNKPLGGHTPEKDQSVLDSLKFIFGANFDKPYTAEYEKGDSIAVVYTKPGENFGSAIFTGGVNKFYTGKITIWYTYMNENGKLMYFPVEGALNDKVGPVVIASELEFNRDGNEIVKVTFSEALNPANTGINLLRFHCWKTEVLDSTVATPSQVSPAAANEWHIVYPVGTDEELIPIVGDSVRFRPPSQLGQATDLFSNLPHEDNPFVRITGEQRITVSSPSIIDLSTSSPAFDSASIIIRSENATVPKLIESDKPLTIDQVAATYGTQGHYLSDLDMGTLVENEIASIVSAVQSKSSYSDKAAAEKGESAPSYTIDQIIAMVEKGDMSIDKAKKKFGIDGTIVDAYKNGLLTAENVHNYSRGSEYDVQAIVGAMANNTELFYRAHYYTSQGHFVNEDSGIIRCDDDIFKGNGSKNCLGSNGRFFLAWNMRSFTGNLAGTGVYIARLQLKVKVNSKVITDRTRDFLWGVRRGQVNAMDLGL